MYLRREGEAWLKGGLGITHNSYLSSTLDIYSGGSIKLGNPDFSQLQIVYSDTTKLFGKEQIPLTGPSVIQTDIEGNRQFSLDRSSAFLREKLLLNRVKFWIGSTLAKKGTYIWMGKKMPSICLTLTTLALFVLILQGFIFQTMVE